MSRNGLIKKGLAVAIIVLFFGLSIAPSIMGVEKTDLISNNEILDFSGLYIILNGTMGENGWYVSCVTITMEATSGDIYIMFMLDNGEWLTYTGPFVVHEDGEHFIKAFGVDPHGSHYDAQAEFKIDQTPPTIELTAEEVEENKWLITAEVYDETSGVNRVEFYVNDEYLGNDTSEPYEWIYNYTPPARLSVKGIIFNPKITEETVSFFAVIAIGHSIFNYPTVQAIVYDNAGNLAINPIPLTPPININYHFYIFKQLTFSNNYSGRIGRFFINAVFEYGPV